MVIKTWATFSDIKIHGMIKWYKSLNLPQMNSLAYWRSQFGDLLRRDILPALIHSGVYHKNSWATCFLYHVSGFVRLVGVWGKVGEEGFDQFQRTIATIRNQHERNTFQCSWLRCVTAVVALRTAGETQAKTTRLEYWRRDFLPGTEKRANNQSVFKYSSTMCIANT